MDRSVAVVIPFYQRNNGILTAALASVGAQRLPAGTRVRVFIVDDASPLSPEAELTAARASFPHEIVLLERPNGGPGAARNTALDHLRSEQIDYVAFLDSDDTWRPDHLAGALDALERSSFYFSNCTDDEDGEFFGYLDYMTGPTAPAPDTTTIVAGPDLFNAMLHECLPHTSQVVFDYRRHGNIRFNESLRRAGEDYMFWLELSHAAAFVSFSTAVMGDRGSSGISLFRSTLSWDAEHAPDRVIDEIRFRYAMLDKFGDTQARRKIIRRKVLDRELSLVFLATRALLQRRWVTANSLRRMLAEQPRFAADLPGLLLKLPGFYGRLRAGEQAV